MQAFKLSGKNYSIPTKWSDLEPSVRIKVVSLLLKFEREFALIACIETLLKINRFQLIATGVENVSHILNQMDEIDIVPSVIPIVDSFPLKRKFRKSRILKLPSDEFKTGTAIQFAVAADAYLAFSQSNDKTQLVRLFCALARDKPLIENNLDAEIAKMPTIPDEYLFIVLRYFEGIQKMVHDLGNKYELWDSGKSSNYSFGLTATYRGLVEYDLIRYDDMCQRLFWDVFQIIIEKHLSYETIKSASDNISNEM
jgi:hypothetical protein